MLKKYINEEWNWAILIFMLSKSLLEADGYLEPTAYIFHDKGTDLITGQKRTIPIYTQIDDIEIDLTDQRKAYKQLQDKCFETSADGILIIGQFTDTYDFEDDDADFSDAIFCRIEHNNKHFVSSTPVIEIDDYVTFDLDDLVNFQIYNNQNIPKDFSVILPCNQE
jgi:hypothetical protein